MNLMQAQINRAISLAIIDRKLAEIQNIMGILPLDQNDTGTGTFSNERGFVNVWKNQNTNLRRRTQGPHVILG